MHGKTRTTFKQLQENFRRLEIAELFKDAGEQGRDHWAGHVLDEANLDYVTDGSFDDTDTDKVRVEQV